MIGSRKKVQTILENLKHKELRQIERVYAPIGMDIGAKTAEEIAVSIMAEIIAHKRKKQKTGGGESGK